LESLLQSVDEKGKHVFNCGHLFLPPGPSAFSKPKGNEAHKLVEKLTQSVQTALSAKRTGQGALFCDKSSYFFYIF